MSKNFWCYILTVWLIVMCFMLYSSYKEIEITQEALALTEKVVLELKEENSMLLLENSTLKKEIDNLSEKHLDVSSFDWDFDYVVRVVGAETVGEPSDGIIAVAQCIKNTAERTGMTPEEVVKVPNQYAPPIPNNLYLDKMELVNECCLLVFLYDEKVVDNNIEYFCTPAHNSFHRSHYNYVCTIGGHEFYTK